MGHHPIHLIIKIPFCRGHRLVSIHRGHKYLHFFGPILRPLFVSYLLYFLPTNFSVIFFPNSWPFNQTVGHSPWTAIWSYIIAIWSWIWPFLLSCKMNNQVHCLNSAYWENLYSTLSFRDVPLRFVVLRPSTFGCSLHIVWTISKSDSRLLLCQLILGD